MQSGLQGAQAGQPKTLLVVACCYALPPGLLRQYLRRLARECGISMQGVIVSNRVGKEDAGDEDWSVIAGSNLVHDFSAYAEGLAYLGAATKAVDSIVFINDSLFTSHHPLATFKALTRWLPALERMQAPAIAGKADRYATICFANPWNGLGIYISTYCFGLNRAAVPILAGLDALAAMDVGDRSATMHPLVPQWGGEGNIAFRELVRTFLLYGPPDFSWPGLKRYVPDDALLAVKARCIYLEHRLSGEIGCLGCILPINLRLLARIRLNSAERFAALKRRMRRRPI